MTGETVIFLSLPEDIESQISKASRCFNADTLLTFLYYCMMYIAPF